MDDGSSSRQRKQAASMSDEERDDKLYELSELHNNWLRSEVKDTQEQTDIFMVWYTLSQQTRAQLFKAPLA